MGLQSPSAATLGAAWPSPPWALGLTGLALGVSSATLCLTALNSRFVRIGCTGWILELLAAVGYGEPSYTCHTVNESP